MVKALHTKIQQRSFSTLCLVLALCSTLCGAASCNPPAKNFDAFISEGQAAEREGKFDVAEQKFSEAYAAAEKKYGTQDPRLITCMGYVVELFHNEREYLRERKALRDLIDTIKDIQPDSAELALRKDQLKAVKAKIKELNLGDRAKDPDDDYDDDDEETASSPSGGAPSGATASATKHAEGTNSKSTGSTVAKDSPQTNNKNATAAVSRKESGALQH